MLMTGAESVLKFWAQTTDDFFDFEGSAMLPWVDVTIPASDTSRATQARLAFEALRAQHPEHDPLAGFQVAMVLTHPGRMTVPNPLAGLPGQPPTIVTAFDGGSTTVGGLPVAVIPVMSSDHTFMCHELGHTLGFLHSFGLDNNGTDWNPLDATIIAGPEYGSPYDLMSSASFGTRWQGVGPLYAGNPTFAGTLANGWPFAGANSMGPNITRANLRHCFPDALTSRVVGRTVPVDGEVGRVRLTATGSQGDTTLLLLRPAGDSSGGAGRILVEFRNGTGWDRGLDTVGPDLARVGVVVHTVEDVKDVGLRAWYRGAIPLGGTEDDLDVQRHNVVVSLCDHEDRGADTSWVEIAYRLRDTHLPKATILWANASDGMTQLWTLNRGRLAWRVNIVDEDDRPVPIGYPWHVIGIGDFNRDGHADILWANASDGSMQIWFMDAGKRVGRATVVDEQDQPVPIGYPWHVIGIGDFNRDGHADILWANASDGSMQIWFMDAGKRVGRATVVDEQDQPVPIGYPWHVVGTEDFNRNGNTDILWVNASDGSMQLWFMHMGKRAARANVVDESGQPVRVGYPWRIMDSGERTFPAHSDILWHNAETNEIQLWFMDAGRRAGRATVVDENGEPAFVGLPWQIVGAADFTCNGCADILWHNAETNEIQLWFMDAGRRAGRATVVDENGEAAFVGLPWQIVGT
jgi:VCBS repeat protein